MIKLQLTKASVKPGDEIFIIDYRLKRNNRGYAKKSTSPTDLTVYHMQVTDVSCALSLEDNQSLIWSVTGTNIMTGASSADWRCFSGIALEDCFPTEQAAVTACKAKQAALMARKP